MTTTNARPPSEAELAAIKARVDGSDGWAVTANDGPCDKQWAVSWPEGAVLVRHAHADLTALLAAVFERDGVIHDMQQESWAYGQGVEDGRRELWGGLRPDDKAFYRDQVLLEFDRSLPPDAVRAENARLRAALGRVLAEIRYTPHPGGGYMLETGDMLALRCVARDALGAG